MLDLFKWAFATTICLILLDVWFSNQLGPIFWSFVSAGLLVISLLSYLRFYQKPLAQQSTSLVLALRLWLIVFIFLSVIYLLVWPLPREYEIAKWFQRIAVLIFFIQVVGFWFTRWSGRHEESALIRLARNIEKIWLWRIDPKRREQYEWHGRWRLEVFFRRIRRWRENFNWDRDLINLRPLLVLVAAGLAYGLLYWALLVINISPKEWLEKTMKATDVGIALFGAPIAFVIWWFRDNNNRQQIENQRKDINLKDFQKLAEWVVGMHLPEDKLTRGRNGKEKYSAHETSAPILDATLPVTSRREGAASLQIAAIYQLQAFLNGDYGRQFQRPAFQLLKSMWLAVVKEQLEEWEKNDTASLNEKRIAAWCDELHRVTNTPLGRAINVALINTHGRVLRAHVDDLPEAIFVGIDVVADGLELDSLQGLILWGTDLRGADLRGAQLQGTRWFLAKMQGANLGEAQLQGAAFLQAWLQGARLEGAKLQGADLGYSTLREANLRNAQLQGANLSHARLEEAQLQGSSLIGAQLQGAALHNFGYDAKTSFHHCRTDTRTCVLVRVGNVVNTAATFVLRNKLRSDNGLILPDILYTQIFSANDPLAKIYKIQEA